MEKETLKKFEQILKDRINEISLNIDIQNTSLKEINNSGLKDQGDIIQANLQGQLDFLIIQKHGLELQDIMISLEKIKNKTYGICEMCDDEIDIERLKIKPHAKYCIKCRELHEKSKNRGEK